MAAIVVAKRASGSVASAPGGRTGLPASEAIARYGDAILVDASPTNPQTGEPGLSLVRHALERGHSAVLASKGPLVVAFAELVALARNKGCRIGMSAAVGTPLPSLELVHLGLRGSVLRGFRGVFSATANRILAKMEEGASHQEAMADAERAGILEADPRLDLEGWDTAFKTLILARSFWRPDIPAESMEVQGITGITEADIARNRESGHRLRLIGTARQSSSGEVTIRVEAERLPPTDPFYALGPSEKGAEFESDRMGSLFIRSSQAGPEATAAALAKDILNIAAHPDALAL